MNFNWLTPSTWFTNEELKVDFLDDNKPNSNLSINTDIDNIEKNLSNLNYDYPSYQHYSQFGLSKKINKRQNNQIKDDYIATYRRISLKPKVDNAIDEIVNEILTSFDDGDTVKLDFLNDTGLGDASKKAIEESYKKILNLLNFSNNKNDLIKSWYIDGEKDLECVYDNSDSTKGVVGINSLTPIGLRKIKIANDEKVYWKYGSRTENNNEFREYEDSMYKDEQLVHVGSGLWDDTKSFEISYLRLALKAINDLAHIENTIIIFRLTRAKSVNIWNIDVGNMAVNKAKNHLQAVKNDISSNLKYDTTDGSTTTEPTEGIQDDYIFPSRNGKSKTTVDNLEGNTDFISKLDDLEYFRKNMYEALKIPISRVDSQSTLDFDGTDILREEVKFSKNIDKLRTQINNIFKELIKRDLVLKKEITEEDFSKFQNDILFKWNETNNIVEKAKLDNIMKRIEAMETVKDSGLLGKILSNKWVYENVMGLTSQDMEEEMKQIELEKKEGHHQDDNTDDPDNSNEE